MFTLLIRTVLTYVLLAAVLRLMGKRQIIDMQPFDLIVTLIIADVASVPLSDVSIPLFYGVLPVLALFLMQSLVAFGALKSRGMRRLVCGNPVVVIEKGDVLEDAMRAARYTLDDLMEQLRDKDVFSIAEVEYAILETNGALSVLKKKEAAGGTSESPSVLLVSDGKIEKGELQANGLSENGFCDRLRGAGISPRSLFFASLEPDGSLYVQEKQRGAGLRPRARRLKEAMK
jgi:uncharacterized membrane protein YcaP (DUF421 family)